MLLFNFFQGGKGKGGKIYKKIIKNNLKTTGGKCMSRANKDNSDVEGCNPLRVLHV